MKDTFKFNCGDIVVRNEHLKHKIRLRYIDLYGKKIYVLICQDHHHFLNESCCNNENQLELFDESKHYLKFGLYDNVYISGDPLLYSINKRNPVTTQENSYILRSCNNTTSRTVYEHEIILETKYDIPY